MTHCGPRQRPPHGCTGLESGGTSRAANFAPRGAAIEQACGLRYVGFRPKGFVTGTEMEATSNAIGLIVIVTLYIAIGGMSAAGSVFIVRSILSAKWEQIFFGLFLVPIAGFYLAFTAYFGARDAWQLEVMAVAVFTVFGLLGTRFPFVLIIGYLIHGVWDAVHEFTLLGSQQITSVPLGYPYFCATYDFIIAGYFYTRRNDWRAAWSGTPSLTPIQNRVG
jgi:hypothetical protein